MSKKTLITVLLACFLALVLTGNSSAGEAAKPNPELIARKAVQALQAKEFAKAIELFREAIKQGARRPGTIYNLACALSLNGDKLEAVETLKKAVSAGYADFAQMERDNDLDNIRGEPGYKALIAEKDKWINCSAEVLMERLKKRLGDQYFYKIDRKYKLVIAADGPIKSLNIILNELHLIADSHGRNFFTNKPGSYITVIVCKNAPELVKALGPAGNHVAGMYRHGERTLYARLSTGIGTVTHEFTHALHCADMAARGQGHPFWVVEGFGSLFEGFDYDNAGNAKGMVNWRLPGLQKAIKEKTCKDFEALFEFKRSDFPASHAYELSRYLFFYLQEKGLLKEFYREYCKTWDDDDTGRKALEKVLDKKIKEFEPLWRQWVMGLKYARPKPMMGVRFDESFEGKGVRIKYVETDSPAERGGMKKDDIIIELDNAKIDKTDTLIKVLGKKKRGQVSRFKVKRGDKVLELSIGLGIYPDKDKP